MNASRSKLESSSSWNDTFTSPPVTVSTPSNLDWNVGSVSAGAEVPSVASKVRPFAVSLSSDTFIGAPLFSVTF